MSTTNSFGIEDSELTKSSVNTVRIIVGTIGLAALIIGLLMTFQPVRTIGVIVILLGVYFVIAGVAYLAKGVFSKGIKVGVRILDIVLGVVMLASAIIVFNDRSESAIVFGIFLGVFVGIAWIIEGIATLTQIGRSSASGWSIAFAIISIIAGVTLVFSPLWGAITLFWITGIALMVLGIFQIVRAFTFGRSTKKA